MRGTAALKSIEALYKEAETVISDGVPMVAIVKSAPPVAKPDIPVATRLLATTPDHTQPDHSVRDDMPPSDQARPDHKASNQVTPNQVTPDQISPAPATVFDRIEMLRVMAASLDDDNDKAKTEPASSLPDAPPVPDYTVGTRQISDADLENVVKKAVDDIVATTPLDDVVAGNERIESVMANIAEAVGNAETYEPAASAATSDQGADDDSTPASETPAQPATSAKAAAAIDLDDLNKIVANTVKSVIREELSNLVHSTVKSTLDELRATHDDKAKSTPSDR